MRHSKSRFIEDARRVGTGAVENRTYPDTSGSKPTGPDNKFTPIDRDRNRGAKVSIYFLNLL